VASSRHTVRDAMTTILQAALVGAGLPVAAVYGYQVGDFAGQSPVVVVSSAGSRRIRMTRAGSRATFYLLISTFVLYSDGATWGEDDAEDAIDAIEALLADVIDDNQVTANWQALDYSDRSQRISVEIGGEEYIYEAVEIAVEVFS
jgi:hypothetical protein